ncbi:MAG: hypothetical protein WKH64_03465 [Chloroflexia bacterium]
MDVVCPVPWLVSVGASSPAAAFVSARRTLTGNPPAAHGGGVAHSLSEVCEYVLLGHLDAAP